MKKSVILAFMAILLGFTFTSCKEDTQPRLSKPTNFVLNTPPMADQLYVMSATSTINLTVSQPNYGLATTPQTEMKRCITAGKERKCNVSNKQTNKPTNKPTNKQISDL